MGSGGGRRRLEGQLARATQLPGTVSCGTKCLELGFCSQSSAPCPLSLFPLDVDMCVCVSPCPRVPMSLCFLPPVASADGPCSHPVRPGILQLRRGAVRSLCRTCRLIALLRLDVGTGLGDGASSFARVHPMIVYFAGGGNQAFGTPKVAFPKGQGNPCVWGSQQSRSSAIFGIVCPWWSGCRISWNFAATGWGAGGVH